MGGLQGRIRSVIEAAALSKEELRARIDRVNHRVRPPGLQMRADRERFTDCLAVAVEDLARLASGRTILSTKPGPATPFNPFSGIKRLARTDQDEATWLAFLATHAGWDRPDSCGALYRGLGEAPRWTWPAISRDGENEFSSWINDSWQSLSVESPFGNHRKYCTHRPSAPVSTADTIGSFAEWACGGVRQWGSEFGSPEARFDQLYHSLNAVAGFGRTARYDFLRLLGLTGLAEIWPGRCYLEGASGPRRGAALMFAGQSSRGVSTQLLEKHCRELAHDLGVDIQAVEDAVCNWQKRGRAPPAPKLDLRLRRLG